MPDAVYDKAITKMADDDGHFRRKPSAFRNFISRAPGADFPPEKDRYVLYLNLGCPWAHRTNIVRIIKGLDEIIPIVRCSFWLGPEGWAFLPDGQMGSEPEDPLYGFKTMKELYLKADPDYQGRYLVPTLWDKKKETIVSNESSEIIRMFYEEFDDLLPAERKAPTINLLPPELKEDIEAMNEWVYNTVNNGVYKTGFATTQKAYEEHVTSLFSSLDRLEAHLGDPKWKGAFLFGQNLTEADIRLYTTIIRFDVAYFTIFKCNLKMIRYSYPKIHDWVRNLYWESDKGKWDGAFSKTVDFSAIKAGYGMLTLKDGIVPVGPEPPLLPLVLQT